jgi:ferredoxin
MMQFEERTIAGLRVRIDRTLCVAFETCIDSAPEVFRFDEEGIVTFVDGPHDVVRARLAEACKGCPVDALSLFDADGVDLLQLS